ncbi:hypothetical protein [Corynebacterium dentalis]|uniref:hypothetical protein n=1 Tax=Corynebacterium dentalis TaxID=2014528 RepID=UPI0028A1365F|nr:hypothetical protein [Corynebacterium dentalis]
MTSNEQRAVEVLNRHWSVAQETAPTIIHTVEELGALDPDTVIQPLLSELSEWPQILTATGLLAAIRAWEGPWLPAAKVAEGAQVRAARKALEEA